MTLINTVSCDSCVHNTQPFINATQLIADSSSFEILGLNFPINTKKLNEFLENCRFEPVPNLLTPAYCDKACSVHEPCLAYAFVRDEAGTGCELCVTETRGGLHDVVITHAYNNIMIGLQSLQQHILGIVNFI